MITVAGIFLLTLMGFGRTSAQTEGDETLELVSVFGGTINNIVTDGEYAYVDESGYRVTVLDMSDVANPTELGTSAKLSQEIEEMVIVDDTVYIANGRAGVTVIDVSDGMNPVINGSAEPYLNQSTTNALTAAGDYVYALQSADEYSEWQGLVIYNTQDRSAPVVSGVYEMPKGLYEQLHDIKISGEHLYIGSQSGGVVAIDVTDPTSPQLVGSADTDGRANNLVIIGNYAYAVSHHGIYTINISNPEEMSIVRKFSADWVTHYGDNTFQAHIRSYTDIFYDGSYFYAQGTEAFDGIDEKYWLIKFDITDPELPAVVGGYQRYLIQDVAFSDEYIVIAEGRAGVAIHDFDDNSTITQGKGIGYLQDIVVQNDLAYFATDGAGLSIVDVSNPSSPTYLSSLPQLHAWIQNDTAQIRVKENIAYAKYDNGIAIYDVTDSSAPTLLADYPIYDRTGYTASGMGIYQNHLYVTSSDILLVLDVSDPANPYPVNQYTIREEWIESDFMTVIGNYAYVGIYGALHIFDLTNPTQPIEIGALSGTHQGYGHEISRDMGFLYLLSMNNGVTIVDVTDPSVPQIVGQIADNGLGVSDISVVNGFAYLAGESGVAIVDVTDPTSPVEISRDTSINNLNGVNVTNGFAFFTSDRGELVTYLPNPEYGLNQLAQCEQAPMMMSDGTVRTGNFAAENELDWLRFDVEAGKTYRVVVETPAGSATDVAADVYPSCNTAVEIQQSYPFAPGVRFNFTPSSTGTYVMSLYNEDGSQFGDDVNYTVSIEELNSSTPEGAVIIVAGRDQLDDMLQPNIHHVTDNVYRLFSQYGYTADSLHYLASDSNLDPMQNGSLSAAVREVDGSATLANLEYAITTWAQDKVGANGVATGALTLYLMSHGLNDNFALDIPNGERLTPEQLDAWLDTLEDVYPDLKVNVIIDACYSGSFIDPADSVSIDESDRVVISSAGSQELAWASAEGANFSDYFLTSLRQRLSLKQAFDVASAAVLSSPNPQTPWLDDNGNGLPNETDLDGQIASTRGFNYTGSLFSELWEPYVRNVVASDSGSGQVMISAEILDDFGVGAAWAVVYPPSYAPPLEDDGRLVSEQLTTIPMELDTDNTYMATLDLAESGDYTVVVYAQDGDGLVSRPVPIGVTNGSSTIPLTIALLDSDVDSSTSLLFVVTILLSALILSIGLLQWGKQV